MTPRIPLALFLLLIPGTLSADLLSGEFSASTAAIDAAPNERSRPRLATNGREFLSIWTDWRSGARDSGSEPAVFASRMNVEGRRLDPIGIRIDTGFAFDVASDGYGRDFVVAYNCSPSLLQPITCTARVTPGGEVTAGSRIPGARDATLAWNGSHYLMAFVRPAGPAVQQHVIHAVQVDSTGKVFGAESTVLAGAQDPVIATNGRTFFITGQTVGRVEGALVGDQGQVIGRTVVYDFPTLVYYGRDQLALSSDGDSYLAVVMSPNGTSGSFYKSDLVAIQLSRDGSVSSTQTIVSESLSARDPSLSWRENHYVLTYSVDTKAPLSFPRTGEADLFSLRLSAAGSRLAPPDVVRVAPGHQAGSVVVSNVLLALVVWQDEPEPATLGASRRPYARIKKDEVRRFALEQIANSVTQQSTPSAAFLTGQSFAVAWSEAVGDQQRQAVFVGRVAYPVGSASGRGMRLIPTHRDQINPVLSSSDGAALLIWTEQDVTEASQIVAAPINEWGHYAGQPVFVGRGARDARVAAVWNGVEHLVVWEGEDRLLLGRRISSAGALLDADPITITDPRNAPQEPHQTPSIAWNGTHYLFAWREPANEVCPVLCLGTFYDIFAMPVSRTLLPLGVPVKAFAERTSEYPVIASDGRDFVVLGRTTSLRARRFIAGGFAAGNEVVIDVNGRTPAMVWNGREYLVAWEHVPPGVRELRLAAFNAALDVLRLDRLPDDDDPRTLPALAARPGATSLLVYERKAPEEPYFGVTRIMGRWFVVEPRKRSASR